MIKAVNIYNLEVSYFDKKTHVKPDQTISLLNICTFDEHKRIIELLRSYSKGSKEFDEIKAGLPCYTPSIVCSERKQSGIIRHTNILSLDFDNVPNIEVLKQTLSALNFIMYSALSCSGTGLFALVKIAKPNLHKQYFDALVDYFSKLNIEIDKSGSDMTRLRFVSYDENYYLNEHSVVWDTILASKASTYRQSSFSSDADIPIKAIYAVCNYVVANGIDITIGRSKWLTIGSFIGQNLGAAGKEIFRDISQFHPKYNENECNRTYDSASSYNRAIGLGAFLNICKEKHLPDMKELFRR